MPPTSQLIARIACALAAVVPRRRCETAVHILSDHPLHLLYKSNCTAAGHVPTTQPPLDLLCLRKHSPATTNASCQCQRLYRFQLGICILNPETSPSPVVCHGFIAAFIPSVAPSVNHPHLSTLDLLPGLWFIP